MLSEDSGRVEKERLEYLSVNHGKAVTIGGLELSLIATEVISLREQLAELKKQEPIGQVIFGSYGSDGIREASIVCLHDQADWDNFQDGTLLYLEAKPAGGDNG